MQGLQKGKNTIEASFTELRDRAVCQDSNHWKATERRLLSQVKHQVDEQNGHRYKA
ncbi:hypothetical protein GCM10025778_15680 [Paeniglutamicibacter antarcticus]|uniref:Transposase n=1 Tax=Paeniglutamicibacter antarcticus TaxID=494023 RepID=A0ABP9TPX1_9MICC